MPCYQQSRPYNHNAMLPAEQTTMQPQCHATSRADHATTMPCYQQSRPCNYNAMPTPQQLLCHAMLCHAMPCNTMQYHDMTCIYIPVLLIPDDCLYVSDSVINRYYLINEPVPVLTYHFYCPSFDLVCQYASLCMTPQDRGVMHSEVSWPLCR